MANTTNLDLVKPLGTDHALVAQINSNSDKIDAEAGRTRANFAAEYSASSAYAVGAFCTHNGILYQCNTAIGSGGEAWTSGHWTQISAGDAIVANSQAIATLNGKIDPIVVLSTETVASKCTRTAPIEIKPGATGAPRSGYGYIGYCAYGGTSFRHVIVSEYSTGNLFFSFGSNIGTTWYQISYTQYNP